MLVNIFDSTVIIITDIFAMAVGVLTLAVHYMKRKYVGRKAYRKERGLGTVHKTSILEIFLLTSIALSLSLGPRKTSIGKEACIVILCFECYCILAFFAWCFNETLISSSILKLRMTPSLTFRQMYLIGYLLPLPFVIVFVIVATLKDEVLTCNIVSEATGIVTNSTNYYLNQCSISNTTPGKIVFLLTFVLPMGAGIFLTILQLTRMCIVLWETWNSLHVKKNIKERVAKFKSRNGLQRGMLLTHVKLLLLFASFGVVFADENHKDVFKGVFSVCLGAVIIVIFINNCIICDKETNPFIWLENWLKSRTSNGNGTRSLQSSGSLATVYQLTEIGSGTPQLKRFAN